MPNRRRPSRRTRRGKSSSMGGKYDHVKYPLFYLVNAGTTSTTTVETIASTFDRHRPFRISHIAVELTAMTAPCFVSFEVYGPTTTADNVWSSKIQLVPVGPIRRLSYTVPETVNLWFPSGSALTTPLLKLLNGCESKKYQGVLSGVAYVTVVLGPAELNTSCPTFQPEDPRPSSSSSYAELPHIGIDDLGTK